MSQNNKLLNEERMIPVIYMKVKKKKKKYQEGPLKSQTHT